MKFCSYQANGRASYGAAHPDGGIVDLASRIGHLHPTLLSLVQANALEPAAAILRVQAPDYRESEVRFLPIFYEPVTVHCVGLNYAAHSAETGLKQPDFPRTFVKVAASLVGHGEQFEMPTLSGQYDFEGELAVVLSGTARRVKSADAMSCVFGYTCFMDGSVRDYQLQRTLDQGKNFVRSSAMGPYLVTVDEVGDIGRLTLTTRVNGQQMQHTTFDQLIFPVPALIEYISGITELYAGDVIATGTPEGVGFTRTPPQYLAPGDSVEVLIERVGSLKNTVA